MKTGIFQQNLEKKIKIKAPFYAKKRIIKLFRKNPELISKAEGVKITVKPLFAAVLKGSPLAKLGSYYRKKDEIELTNKSFKRYKLYVYGNNTKVSVDAMRLDVIPTLRHELAHREQYKRGLPLVLDYKKSFGRYSQKYMNGHTEDPLEIEARKTEQEVPERKKQVSFEKISESFKEIFERENEYK